MKLINACILVLILYTSFCLNVYAETVEQKTDSVAILLKIIPEGIKSIPESEIYNIIPDSIPSNQLTDEWSNSIKEKIRKTYCNYGYCQVTITERLEENKFVFKINEGIINNITISNNKATADYIIMREIRQKKGSVFNDQTMLNDLQRLNRTGYFNQIYYDVEPNSDGTLDVNIGVDESLWINFGIGLSGYNSIQGIVYYAGANMNRLGQSDNSIALGMEFCKKMWPSYIMTLYNPWVTEDNLSMGISLFDLEPFYLIDNKKPYLVTTRGMRYTLGFPLLGNYYESNLRGTVGLGITQEAVRSSDYEILPEYSSNSSSDGWDLYYSPDLTISYNSLDNLIMPVEGLWAMGQSSIIAGPGKSSLRLKATGDYYYPIYKFEDGTNITLSLLNSAGFHPLGNPISYRKFLKTIGGVRGIAEYKQIGDNFIVCKQELTYSILKNILWARAFLDEGIFWDYGNFDLNQAVAATGVGASLWTPMGLLNFNYGFKISDFTQNTFRFNITFSSYNDNFTLAF